jgi:superfamily II DNA or RNA helicase
MKLTLKNQITITTPIQFSEAENRAIESIGVHNNPAYAEALRFGRSVRMIPKEIQLCKRVGNTWIVPIGLLDEILDEMPYAEVDDRRKPCPVTIPFTGSLRDYQEQFISDAMDFKSGVMVAATGSGKTVSGIAMAARLGQRCLILVKSKDLAKQWQDAIKQFTGLDAGLIGGGKDSQGGQFTIGLIQTLCKRDLSQLDYGLVICDECHNTPAQQAYSVINGINARYKFGLSATPQRRDNLEFMIHGALGVIVSEIEPHELQGKVLPVHITTRAVAFTGCAESWQEFLTELVSDEARNRMIINDAIRSASKRGTIILCAQVAHCEALGVLAQELGVTALVLHGQLPTKERTARMTLAQESPLIIGTLSLLSEGIDLPHLTALIFASPVSAEPYRDTPAATRLMQSIGRCRRPYPNKHRAYVLDFCDKHPFGYAAHNKRMAIYKQQGFEVVHHD